MASKVSIISKWTVKAAGGSQHHTNNCKIIELSPWDILELQIDYVQSGFLYHMPTSQQVRDLSKSANTTSLIDHLRASLSRVLDFYPPLCGRLEVTTEQSGTSSFFINCNNAGVQLNHAIADGVTVCEIMESNFVPHVVHNFFSLNGAQNKEATSQPFLALQITELVDGIFIGCTYNHALVDGISFLDFYNSWVEISRGFNVISKIPYLKREFPFKFDHFSNRISIPNERINSDDKKIIPPALQIMLREKVFHFTKENVSKLKAKANLEMNTTKISSLQAVMAHVWVSVIRCRRLDHNQETTTTFEVSINMRERVNPPLPEGFFGNAIYPAPTTIKTGELLKHGLGWAALQINETIASHDHEKLKCIYENWMKDPEVTELGDLPSIYFMLNGSPQFDYYQYDFGWGKPIAHRSGVGNMFDGKITVLPGVEEGSMILEICLSSETIQALEEDIIFGEFVNTPIVGVERTIRARI